MTESRNRYMATESSEEDNLQSQQPYQIPDKMSIKTILNDNEQKGTNGHAQRATPPLSRHGTLQCRPCYHDMGSSLQHSAPAYYPDRTQTQDESRHFSYMLHPQAAHSAPPQQNEGPRPPRYRYGMQEYYFIWYHRIDLGWPWDKVEQKFRQFFVFGRSRGGLQCKLYRILDDHGVPRIREQHRESHRRGSDEKAGPRVNFRDFFQDVFPWMLAEHRNQYH